MKGDAITWGDLDSYEIAVEKSADAILATGNELRKTERTHKVVKG